jgi:mannosyltransferase OCH1-like enzyme
MASAKKCKHCGERLTTKAREEHIEPKWDHTAELDSIISGVKPFARAYFLFYGITTLVVFVLLFLFINRVSNDIFSNSKNSIKSSYQNTLFVNE